MAWPLVAAAVVGAVIQSKAQSDAANSYSRSANKQAKSILDMYNQMTGMLSPYTQAGKWALGIQEIPNKSTPKLSFKDWVKKEGIPFEEGKGVSSSPGYVGLDAAESGQKPESNAVNSNAYQMYQQYVQDWNENAAGTTVSSEFREGSYMDLLQKGPGEFTEDPGYQFRKGEGEKSIDKAASAGGGFFSGKRGKALVEYGQQFASNEYDKFMNRYYKKLDAYGNLIGVGESAAARVGSAGQTAVGQSANIQMGSAQMGSSATVQQGNIWGNAINEGGATLADYYSGGGTNTSTIRGGEGGGYGF